MAGVAMKVLLRTSQQIALQALHMLNLLFSIRIATVAL